MRSHQAIHMDREAGPRQHAKTRFARLFRRRHVAVPPKRANFNCSSPLCIQYGPDRPDLDQKTRQDHNAAFGGTNHAQQGEEGGTLSISTFERIGPFALVAWVPFYNRIEPTLWGIPFFYWYQLAAIIVGAFVVMAVYFLDRRQSGDTEQEDGPNKPGEGTEPGEYL